MKMVGWSRDDRDEYREMCHLAHTSGTKQPERIDDYLERLEGALSTGRMWARDADREIRRAGATREMSGYAKQLRPRVAVSFDGAILSKPVVVGASFQDDEGKRYVAQTLFDYMSWDQIQVKAREYLTSIKAFRADLALCVRLLELAEEVPDAANPHDALVALGMSMQEWLDSDEAAAS